MAVLSNYSCAQESLLLDLGDHSVLGQLVRVTLGLELGLELMLYSLYYIPGP